MEMTQVPEYKRKLVMTLHLPPYMDMTAEQRDREDQFFGDMFSKGLYTVTRHGMKGDAVAFYKDYSVEYYE